MHLTWRVGFAPIESIYGLKLIQKGYSSDALTNISSLMIPLQFIISVFIGKSARNKKEMTLWTTCFKYKILLSIFMYMVLLVGDPQENWMLTSILIFISLFIDTLISNSVSVVIPAFHNRICDPAIGGTFLTTLAAVSNFGLLWPDSLSLFAESYIPWTIFGVLGWIYAFGYMKTFGKTILALENKDKKEFTIIQKKEDLKDKGMSKFGKSKTCQNSFVKNSRVIYKKKFVF